MRKPPRTRYRGSSPQPRTRTEPHRRGNMGDAKATIAYEGGEVTYPVVAAVEGNSGIDLGTLRTDTGLVSLDYGFANTAGTKSGVSFVDGAAGELRYRGYPIEQLAARSSFLEGAHPLFHREPAPPPRLRD